MRSWLFAAKIGQMKAIDCDLEVVAVGTILHDIGLTAGVSGSHRFEVNGADASLSFIKDRGLSGRRAQLVWDLVALNSTPSIALHKEPEVALGTMGIGLDYGGFGVELIPPADISRNYSCVPASQDERQICRDLPPSRRDETGDELRQLSARFRRTLRARLQGHIGRRPVDERAVRGIAPLRDS